MFLIPLARKLDWRHPPIVTLLIVLANVLVYALWQQPSEEAREAALVHYYESGLADIELPRYADFLEQRRETERAAIVQQALDGDERSMVHAVYQLQIDEDFLRLLHTGQAVTARDADHAGWRQQRERFEELLAQDFDWQHAFIPAVARWDTWLTHMFMHADWGHLAGNMMALLLVSFVVEQVLGWWRFLALYLLTGLGAVALFLAFNPHSAVPLLGASGAVAGVNGLYAAMFGLRRINFFYFFFVYFDYVKAPAILLLVYWLANEIYQQVTDVESHIAYIAHIGGLLTGAGLIGLLRLAGVARLENFLARETGEETDRQQFDQAMALAEGWKLEEASAILERLTARRPDDYELLVEAYKVARRIPDNPAYHSIAGRVLALPAGNRAVLETVAETFREYLEIARPRPRLSASRAAGLAEIFAAAGLLRESERLAEMLVKQKTARAEVASALLAVAEALLKGGQHERARRWLTVVATAAPGSPQADRASALLRRD
jgi:membrane associated rhomboid family serine protease